MVKLIDDPVSWFAEKSGIHKTIVKKYFDELEEAGVDWQFFDIETIAEEIKDFGQTGGSLEHPELRSRLGLSPVIEKTAEESAREQEIEGLLFDKPGVKTLLKRIYENKELTDKQKEDLKKRIIAGAPEIATLVALYDGKEQEYAKQFLKEMVFSPVSDIRDLLKGDTFKIKSSRGWIKEINDTPLKKPVRSIDLVEHIQDYELVASQPGKEFTIAIYSRKPKLVYQRGLEPGLVQAEFPVSKVIKKEEIPVEVVKTEKTELDYYGFETKDRPHIESFGGSVVDEYVIPESQPAMGGKTLTSREFCYRCGRGVITDQFSKQVNSHIVYFCSELCFYADKQPQRIVPKYGVGQTVSSETIAEIRRKAFVKPKDEREERILQDIDNCKRSLELFHKRKDQTMIEQTEKLLKEYQQELEEYRKPKTEIPMVITKDYNKQAETLALTYGYNDIKKLADQHKLRLKGSKVEMLIELLKHNIL